jgi:hypothetical protein
MLEVYSSIASRPRMGYLVVLSDPRYVLIHLVPEPLTQTAQLTFIVFGCIEQLRLCLR